MFDFEWTTDLFGRMTNQFFDQVRHFLEIGVGPVNFQHGKFRIVLPRNAFIPEISVQFEDFGESANQKALQIKFGSDPQIKIEPERLVVGAERRRRRATGHRLQNRRFHFQETAVFQKPADFAPPIPKDWTVRELEPPKTAPPSK